MPRNVVLEKTALWFAFSTLIIRKFAGVERHSAIDWPLGTSVAHLWVCPTPSPFVFLQRCFPFQPTWVHKSWDRSDQKAKRAIHDFTTERGFTTFFFLYCLFLSSSTISRPSSDITSAIFILSAISSDRNKQTVYVHCSQCNFFAQMYTAGGHLVSASSCCRFGVHQLYSTFHTATGFFTIRFLGHLSVHQSQTSISWLLSAASSSSSSSSSVALSSTAKTHPVKVSLFSSPAHCYIDPSRPLATLSDTPSIPHTHKQGFVPQLS